MLPTNLTALTFDEIKASIKSYMRTRPEFTDYDFEGSTLSYLVDVLAYNTYYNSFNANMALNEIFINSASSRDNVVGIAKLLNYVPRSFRAAQACVDIAVQVQLENGVYPETVTLKRGIVAAGGKYSFVRQSDRTAAVDTSGMAHFKDVLLYEGSIITYNYTVNNYQKQRFIIPADQIDTTSLVVKIRPNAQSQQVDAYNLVENIVDLNSESRVYFLNEVEDSRYELKFGDGTIGRALVDGEVVEIEYIRCNGTEANDINNVTFSGEIITSGNRNVSSADIDLTLKERTRYGDGAESLASIKYNAPRYYSTQYRAVTAEDYSTITKQIYTNADSLIAFGGEEMNPPVYGKVYIAIKTKNNTTLNNTTKKTIQNNLKKYAMASIEPVIIDPDYMYLITDIFVLYDKNSTSLSESELQSLISQGIAQYAGQEKINNFGGSFSLSKLQKAIELADNSIDTSSVQATLLKYIYPLQGQTNTYCIDFGTSLYDSNPSNDGSGNCVKEPILLSGSFRTIDRPDVDQYFEDDGFGNLMTFYNSGTSKVYTNKNAGTVDYATGRVCFGPVNVITTGNIDATINVFGDQTQVVVGDTTVVVGSGQGGIDLQIPVQVIPDNFTTVYPSDTGTILSLPIPEITVAPIGTTPPAVIPINNLTPEVFLSIPETVTPIIPDTTGGLFDLASCF